jgi:hypothetical protein
LKEDKKWEQTFTGLTKLTLKMGIAPEIISGNEVRQENIALLAEFLCARMEQVLYIREGSNGGMNALVAGAKWRKKV